MNKIEKEREWMKQMAEKGIPAVPIYEPIPPLRPDLSHCGWCNDGRLCNCQISIPLYDGPLELWGCACIGFISCPICGRSRK